MKRSIWAVVVSIVFLAATGCGNIEDMIEEATEQTITISRSISNDLKERDTKSVLVIKGINVAGGAVRRTGEVDISELSERIDVARLGLADVTFYLRVRLENHASQPAFVTLAALPNGVGPAIGLGTLTLMGGQTLELDGPGQMDQGYETISENLMRLFNELGDDFVIEPVIEVKGGSQDGVEVDWVKIAAQPVYWKTDPMSPGSLPSYQQNVKEVKNAMLAGNVHNRGDGPATVRIFVSTGDELDTEENLIAETILAPGETMQGHEMLVGDGANKIKQSFKNAIDGQTIVIDFVVASQDPFSVDCNKLRLQADIVVGANVF